MRNSKIAWAVVLLLALRAGVLWAQDNGSITNMPEALKPAAEIYTKGLSMLDQGKYDHAQDAFGSAIQAVENIDSPDGRKLLAAAANNSGNVFMLQLNPEEAERRYRQALAAEPSHALARNNLGAALLKQGRIEEAQAAFIEAVKADPKSALPLNNLAELLIDAGNLKLAAQYLGTSLQLEPLNRETLLMLARLYYLAGMSEQEDHVWETLIRVSGDDPQAKVLVASRLMARGVNDKAGKTLDEVLDKTPGLPEALLQKARLEAATGNAKAAQDILESLVKTYPDDAMARHDLAAVLLQQGLAKEALVIALKATADQPGRAENWFVRGACEERLDDLKAAETSYKKALKQAPQYAEALNNLGILAAKQDDTQAALSYFAKAVAANPYYPDARYNLGRALVVSKADYERGVRLLVAVGTGTSEASIRARTFIQDLETIAAGGDPGWNGKETK
ncbi:MAG: tetratricopeptide repeat protein [Lentisphaerae bacterium]|nr:tetratricopeptide repeat protein [Lentisphaerota bacterium]